MSNDLVLQAQTLVVHDEPVRGGLRAIREPDGYDRVYAFAKKMAGTELVPEHLKVRGSGDNKRWLNEVEIANNVFAVCLLADRLNECPLILMQNLNFIHGRPSFAAQYMINRLNTSGLISGRVHYAVTGSGENLSVTAYATDAQSGERVEGKATYEMAKAEGWTTKKGNKYATMAEQMLKYRAATFLVRVNYPEILFGYYTQDEAQDMAVEPAPVRIPSSNQEAAASKTADIQARLSQVKVEPPAPVAENPVTAVGVFVPPGESEVKMAPIPEGTSPTNDYVPAPPLDDAPVNDEPQPPAPSEEEIKTYYGYPDPREENPDGKSPF